MFYGLHMALASAEENTSSVQKKWSLIGINTQKNENVKILQARVTSFGHIWVLSDPQMNFQKSRDGCGDPKWAENIKYISVKVIFILLVFSV